MEMQYGTRNDHPKGSHRWSSPFFTHALPEPEVFPFHNQDVGIMGQPIQQGSSQLLAANHLWPLGEAQLGSPDERLSFVTPGYHLEEELGSLFRERHIADFVDDQQVHIG
jgi:hypothetical protein